jgi:RNA 3'-terminal phosphate cyclase-like protein
VQFLRDLLTFFGVKFKITPAPRDEEDEAAASPSGTGEVLVSCVGIGYSNVNRSMA